MQWKNAPMQQQKYGIKQQMKACFIPRKRWMPGETASFERELSIHALIL
jgi:hypothetical protein